jgi:hypothetical protein
MTSQLLHVSLLSRHFDFKCTRSPHTLQVTTYTSDVQGAGTDGAVYLTLSGDSGSTEEILLPSDTQEVGAGR